MVDDPNAGADKTLAEPTDADLLTDDSPADDGLDEPAPAEPAEALPAGAPPEEKSRVAPSLRPGPLARAWQKVCTPFCRLTLPTWNLRTFAWLLLGLVVLAFLIANWAPMRFFFFGLRPELPKSIAIIVLLGVGFAAGRLTRAPKPQEDE